MLDAVDEVGAKPLHLADTPDGLDSLRQLLKQKLDLDPGEICAKTVVLAAAAERDVLVGRARDVESERIVEDFLVAIGGDLPDSDFVARHDSLVAQLGIAHHVATEVHDGRGAPRFGAKERRV